MSESRAAARPGYSRRRARAFASLVTSLFALAITLTAAPALARFATSFHVVAQKAPLIIRAKVVSITELSPNHKQMELQIERTLVGRDLGDKLTLPLYSLESEYFTPGERYLVALSATDSLYYDVHNRCGTQFAVRVVDGTVPRFGRLLRRPASLAVVEDSILCKRETNLPSCLRSGLAMPCGLLERSQLLFYFAMLLIGGHAAWLIRRRRQQPAAETPSLAVRPLTRMITRVLGWLAPPLHR